MNGDNAQTWPITPDQEREFTDGLKAYIDRKLAEEMAIHIAARDAADEKLILHGDPTAPDIRGIMRAKA